MIRINLLPHREAKRKQNKIAFFRLLGVAGAFAGVVAFLIWAFIGHMISDQDDRNALIKNANTELDKQIDEIKTLTDDIAALKARQQAVEDLQSDRNQPVYLFDELVKQVPEGIFLRSFKQEGQKVVLQGTAQSNERVSDLLRNFSDNSPWLEKPELVEIKASSLGVGRDTKRVFDFSMNVSIKRPRDNAKDDGKGAPGAPKAAAAAQSVSAPTPAVPAASVPAAPAANASAAAASASKKP
jgi:type IV pilus assembly protein PilN